MSGRSDLDSTLAHHDAAIDSLSTRMVGVESGLRSLHGEVHSGFVKVSDKFSGLDASFAEIKTLIARSEAKQGPGLGDVMKLVAMGGAIVGMAAAAITMLVTSFVSPELTNLKDTADVLSKDHDARVAMEREELAALRNQRRDRFETNLDQLSAIVVDLQQRLGWQATVTQKPERR